MNTNKILIRMNLIYFQINSLIETANLYLPEEDRRTGGYLTIMDAEKGQIIAVLSVGKIPVEKQDKYLTCSIEKAFRLFEHPEHRTSWESRDDANMQYPGAIRGIEAIYSFSGHLGDVDEGMSTTTFYLMEPMGKKALPDKEAKIFFNYYYEEVAKRNRFIQPLLLKSTNLSRNNWVK